MGVIEREGENRSKRFRCAIERHGVRFERWFHTREEAENAWITWDKKLIEMFGRRSNKKIEALNARRAAKAKLTMELEEKKTAIVHCGLIRACDYPKRCRDHLICCHYEDCLGVAATRNWAGWVMG